MKAIINKDIVKHPNLVWVEAGEYEVLRTFDKNRLLIEIRPEEYQSRKRLITVVKRSEIFLTIGGFNATAE